MFPKSLSNRQLIHNQKQSKAGGSSRSRLFCRYWEEAISSPSGRRRRLAPNCNFSSVTDDSLVPDWFYYTQNIEIRQTFPKQNGSNHLLFQIIVLLDLEAYCNPNVHELSHKRLTTYCEKEQNTDSIILFLSPSLTLKHHFPWYIENLECKICIICNNIQYISEPNQHEYMCHEKRMT